MPILHLENAHTQSAEQVLFTLASNADSGLSDSVAADRLAQIGNNELSLHPPRSAFSILLAQFRDLMIWLLFVAAALAVLIGEPADAIAIVAILLLNAGLGLTQELRAEKALTAMRQLAAPKARVRRSNQVYEIAASRLVPGDIVLLESGNLVPADLRLLESAQLTLNESTLTGESAPVLKNPAALYADSAAMGDRLNLAYNGTVVTHGLGSGVVIATGKHTQLGQIDTLLKQTDATPSPLQQQLATLGRYLTGIVLLTCVALLALSFNSTESWLVRLMTAISLAVAAIPESLPAVVSIALALGAYRLVKQQALMRRLPSVEALGAITWICSDKTGTLTQNRMQVVAMCTRHCQTDLEQPYDSVSNALLQGMALCHDVSCSANGWHGDPMEVALVQAAASHQLDVSALQQQRPRLGVLPFDSTRMCMTTLHTDATGFVSYTKGAPETLIPRCSTQLTREGPIAFTHATALQQAAAMANAGMRVLAMAQRRWDAQPALTPAHENALTFIGLIGLLDPPRTESAAAIATCQAAGITPCMITGDHPVTALAIAERLGIASASNQVMTGAQLQHISDSELQSRVHDIRVFARMDPAQKIRIVQALQHSGELVAMTGDGVNDAPALKQANIGIAMGKGGTDVAREAADMVLLDDNFATIVSAIQSGRHIYDNIRRFIRYVLTTNLAEILIIFLAPLFGLPLPLLPLQILWINLVTDGLPGLALTLEPPESDSMQRPPRAVGDSLLSRGLWQHVLVIAVLMSSVVLGLQAWSVPQTNLHWQSLVFTTLTFTQLSHVLAIRSDHNSLWQLGLRSNLPLFYTVLGTVALHLALLYHPLLQRVFNTSALTLTELALCCGGAVLILLAVELEKWLIRHQYLYQHRKTDDHH